MRYLKVLLLLAALVLVAPIGVARGNTVGSFCSGAPEQELLKLINDYRASQGLGKLVMGQHIAAAAGHHSKDMGVRNYFSHTTLGTSKGPTERMLAHGYPADTTWGGETIAAGNSDPSRTFEQWKNSSGHNAIMLSTKAKAIGIDRTGRYPDSRYGYYWTANFGGALDSEPVRLC